jgi:hypothetical protein
MLKLKKGEREVAFFGAYRFLSIRIITSPTTTIAMIMPMVAGTKYMSATDAGVGVGAGVGSGADSTFMAV